MVYGDFYARLSVATLKSVSGIHLNRIVKPFVSFYFLIFGYPDLASWMRFRFVTKHLQLTEGDTLLDVGSGNGIYTNQYAFYFHIPVLGLEGRDERVNCAQRIGQELNLTSKFRVLNLEKARLPRKKFNKIICIEVLEHILNDRKLLGQMAYVLKKGGKLIITVPFIQGGTSEEFASYGQFEHVRNGYQSEFFWKYAVRYSLSIELIQPYFLLFSKKAVRIQQWIYKNMPPLVNILVYPLLQVVSLFDGIVPLYGTARGLFIVMRK